MPRSCFQYIPPLFLYTYISPCSLLHIWHWSAPTSLTSAVFRSCHFIISMSFLTSLLSSPCMPSSPADPLLLKKSPPTLFVLLSHLFPLSPFYVQLVTSKYWFASAVHTFILKLTNSWRFIPLSPPSNMTNCHFVNCIHILKTKI